MMKKRLCVGVLAALGLAVLIFDAKTALHAAQDAVQLCIRVIIPSLFPFFVLINLLSGAMLGSRFSFLTPLERRMHLPSGSGSLFITGLLGGYPTGAQLVHRAWKDGTLDRSTAQRMLAFCSNAGPAFIFGIVGPMFSESWAVWLIWGIHILSSVFVGCIYKQRKPQYFVPLKASQVSISDALKKAVSVMGYVCGWIVLFRVFAAFCERWFLWLLPKEIQILFISILELANGCTSLDLIENEGLRMIIASAAVNFGGVCVLMQTESVTSGLNISDYLKGKLLQTAFAAALSAIAQYFLFRSSNRCSLSLIEILVLLFILLVIFLLAGKFTVAFQRELVYNGVRNKGKG